MWGIIKKAINSTLGTDKFKPLDTLIEKVVNDGGTPLDQILFGDKSLTFSDNIYCIVDTVSIPANTTVNSSKRLFIHTKGEVSFAIEGNCALKTYQNNSTVALPSNEKVAISLHDYFDFSVQNSTDKEIVASIYMKAQVE